MISRLVELHPANAQGLLNEAVEYKMGIEFTSGAVMADSYDYDKQNNEILINQYYGVWPFRVDRSLDDQAEALYRALQKYIGDHTLGNIVEKIYNNVFGNSLSAGHGVSADTPDLQAQKRNYSSVPNWLRVTGNILQVDIEVYAQQAAATGLLSAAVIAAKTKFASAVRLKNCFPAGTPVATEHGMRPIEEVKAGERVWGFDLVSGTWRLCRVLQTFRSRHEGLTAHVTAAGGTVEATYRHPFWVVSGEDLEDRPREPHLPGEPHEGDILGRWVDAGDLRPGDVLILKDGRTATVEVVRHGQIADYVYNIEVDDLHTYAVGPAGLLVHNDNGPFIGVHTSNGRVPVTFGKLEAKGFTAPKIYTNRHGQLTNGIYTLDGVGMRPHLTGSLAKGKSQFMYRVNTNELILDAASYADQAGLWVGNKAKIIIDRPIGVHAGTGGLTEVLNIYNGLTNG